MLSNPFSGRVIANVSGAAYFFAGLNLIASIGVLIMALIAAKRLQGSVLHWAAFMYLATGVAFVAHAFIEVFGLGQDLYTLTALIVTIFLGFSVVIIDITTKMLGVKS